MSYAIVGLLLLLADQFLKFWTVAHVELNAYPGIELIPGVLNLTYIKNTGIAFGLFGGSPLLRWVLLALLVAFTAFIMVSLATGYLRTGFARWTGALLLTGLIGNGVDRAVYGYVVDMLEPKLGSISWPIFNIADALILIFGILFCIAVLTGGYGAPRRKKKKVPAGRRSREEAETRPARRPRPEGARSASAHKGAPRTHNASAHPARRKLEDEASKPAPAPAERPARVTEAQAAETLRQNGSAMRPAEEPKAIPVVKAEETPVQTVERPAPAAESAPKSEPKSAASKATGDDLDLDAILAEFK